MSLVSVMELQVDPAKRDEAAAAFKRIFDGTRGFEGNEGVEVLEDNSDPTRLVAIIRWESAEAQKTYRAWRATPEGHSGLTDWVVSDPIRHEHTPHATI